MTEERRPGWSLAFDDAAFSKLAQDFGKPADTVRRLLQDRAVRVEKVML